MGGELSFGGMNWRDRGAPIPDLPALAPEWGGSTDIPPTALALRVRAVADL